MKYDLLNYKNDKRAFVPHWYLMTVLIVTTILILAAILVPRLIKFYGS